ncbi:MAG: CCA tRNA nucleotidyltransferase, partial [Oscillospiraceae bacterium]
MIFSLPNNILLCLQILESNGFESFCVGGCVRDMLMDKVPHDYDITTNASPEQILRIFPKTIPTGIRHGTVTVLLEND